ncbi:DUF2274 domain-containing protein [Pseudacidovorax sp. NFM-22]|uniref:DUF2274 domain-containing protein n=1 Tax=Pseudacidovorax sp. NFM-22 TaxID=2744469 RepID=UPI001F24F22E|nr:DUF2274 domain-containing protein [Pseudacidovorax sp. NFM-22]
MTSTSKLRLGPLPKYESVKVTFSCPVGLKNDLEKYADLHAQTYGEGVDAVALIPHMLDAFISRDRLFKRATAGPGLTARPAMVPTPPSSTAGLHNTV